MVRITVSAAASVTITGRVAFPGRKRPRSAWRSGSARTGRRRARRSSPSAPRAASAISPTSPPSSQRPSLQVAHLPENEGAEQRRGDGSPEPEGQLPGQTRGVAAEDRHRGDLAQTPQRQKGEQPGRDRAEGDPLEDRRGGDLRPHAAGDEPGKKREEQHLQQETAGDPEERAGDPEERDDCEILRDHETARRAERFHHRHRVALLAQERRERALDADPGEQEREGADEREEKEEIVEKALRVPNWR